MDFSFDILAKRLRELSFLNSGVKIDLVDERDDKKETFQFEGGISAFVQYLDRAKKSVHDAVFWFRLIRPWLRDRQFTFDGLF